jgi:hypothetical protein
MHRRAQDTVERHEPRSFFFCFNYCLDRICSNRRDLPPGLQTDAPESRWRIAPDRIDFPGLQTDEPTNLLNLVERSDLEDSEADRNFNQRII